MTSQLITKTRPLPSLKQMTHDTIPGSNLNLFQLSAPFAPRYGDISNELVQQIAMILLYSALFSYSTIATPNILILKGS